MINKKKFAKTILDKIIKAFVIYIISFSLNLIIIYLTKKAYIALLIAKKVKVLTKYLDFLDVFFKKNTSILLKITNFNQHVIKL